MQFVQPRNTNDANSAFSGSNVVTDVYNLRLMTLLRQLVRKKKLKGAAGKLGLDPRTVATCLREGTLSRRVQMALERSLKSELESETARQRERMDNLEGKLSGVEDKLPAALEGIEETLRSEVKALRRDCDRGLRTIEKRLGGLERDGGPGQKSTESPSLKEARVPSPPWRQHPDVVTPDAEPGEEDVYGEAAPLVGEWRSALAAVRTGRDGLAGLDARSRLLEIEIDLIEKYKFTLPPSKYPWYESERRDSVRVKTRALGVLRTQRKRAELRRVVRKVLTLGRWRN